MRRKDDKFAPTRNSFPSSELTKEWSLPVCGDKFVLSFFPGNQEKGDMGLGAVPGRQPEFREALAVAVKYARELKCPG